MKKFGINTGEWRILGCIGQMGPLTAAQIVTEGHQDKANVSRSISALTKKNLATKLNNPFHKNSPFIWLTQEGQKVYDRIIPDFTAQASMFTSVLSKSEKARLCDLLDKLRHYSEYVHEHEQL